MKKTTFILIAFALAAGTVVKAQDIKLIQNELMLVDYFCKGEDCRYDEKAPFSADSLLNISISTASYYNSLKERQIPYIVADTAMYRKKDGILKLPVGATRIEFTDVDTDNESYQHFYYMGQIPFLNSYLIMLVGWEYFNYFLIDKKTGENSGNIFVDYPFISPNKKHVVCIYACPYFTRAEMQVFAVIDGKLESLYYFSFVNWMPTTQTTSLVWIDDYSFVVKAVHPESFWDENGNQNENGEYIKIEILKETKE